LKQLLQCRITFSNKTHPTIKLPSENSEKWSFFVALNLRPTEEFSWPRIVKKEQKQVPHILSISLGVKLPSISCYNTILCQAEQAIYSNNRENDDRIKFHQITELWIFLQQFYHFLFLIMWCINKLCHHLQFIIL